MKKLIALLLSAAMLLSVSACQKKEETAAQPSPTASTEPTQLPQEESTSKYTRGKTERTTYTSEFVGLGFELQEGWEFFSEEAMRAVNNTHEEMGEADFEAYLKKEAFIYDMCAANGNQTKKIEIALEAIDNEMLKDIDIAQSYESQIPDIQLESENLGYSEFSYEVKTMTIDGKESEVLSTISAVNDVNMYRTIFLKKCDGYMAKVTVTTLYDDTTAQILETFYWLQ